MAAPNHGGALFPPPAGPFLPLAKHLLFPGPNPRPTLPPGRPDPRGGTGPKSLWNPSPPWENDHVPPQLPPFDPMALLAGGGPPLGARPRGSASPPRAPPGPLFPPKTPPRLPPAPPLTGPPGQQNHESPNPFPPKTLVVAPPFAMARSTIGPKDIPPPLLSPPPPFPPRPPWRSPPTGPPPPPPPKKNVTPLSPNFPFPPPSDAPPQPPPGGGGKGGAGAVNPTGPGTWKRWVPIRAPHSQSVAPALNDPPLYPPAPPAGFSKTGPPPPTPLPPRPPGGAPKWEKGIMEFSRLSLWPLKTPPPPVFPIPPPASRWGPFPLPPPPPPRPTPPPPIRKSGCPFFFSAFTKPIGVRKKPAPPPGFGKKGPPVPPGFQ